MPKINLSFENVVFTKKFIKNLKNLDSKTRERIQQKLKIILSGFRNMDIKKLSNYPIADFRLKIDEYRLFFNYSKKQDKAVFVACVARKNLY